LFGLTTVVLHSFVDFGLHLPAIAILATVIAGQLCALGELESRPNLAPRDPSPAPSSAAYSLRLWGIAPLGGAIVLTSLALILVVQGWREDRVERLRQNAARLASDPARGAREQAIAELETAANLAPESALLQAQAGEAHLQLFRDWTAQLAEREALLDIVQVPASFATLAAAVPGTYSPPSAVPSWLVLVAARQERWAERRQGLARRHLGPGLWYTLRARDRCPLLPQAQLQLAVHADLLAQGDRRRAYLDRAKLLAPDNPEVWYLSGLDSLFDDDKAQAWESWRRCLELSDRYLREIV